MLFTCRKLLISKTFVLSTYINLQGKSCVTMNAFSNLNQRHWTPYVTMPHYVVFANEKGGVGKSTTAFLTCIALCHAGKKVAVIDLDYRQRSMTRGLENREGTSRRLGINFPSPRYVALRFQTEATLAQEIARISTGYDFVIIDTPGYDAPIVRIALALANTLVTPINDSFVDLDVLGHVDPVTYQARSLGVFAQLVQSMREVQLRRQNNSFDWVVAFNRMRRLGANNERRILSALQDISNLTGFRICPGLGDRVIYRELFPLGLTLSDLRLIPDIASGSLTARHEFNALLEGLNLLRDKGLQQFVERDEQLSNQDFDALATGMPQAHAQNDDSHLD
jgi:chromosome partitioning protein